MSLAGRDRGAESRIAALASTIIEAVAGEEDPLVIGHAFGSALGCLALASRRPEAVLAAADGSVRSIVAGDLLD